jgi:hypothetical protein
MNSINIDGHKLKTIVFSGNLYRADRNFASAGISAAQNYKDAPMKYFTLYKDETIAYTKYGMRNIKSWKVTAPLVLIDIFDISTRNSLKELIGADALNIAFPLNKNGKVYRVSEENTKNKNDDVLRNICSLGGVDGYLMHKQEERSGGIGSFHSEVGLCAKAFSKLVLVDLEKANVAPVIAPRRNKRKTVSNMRRLNFSMNNNVVMRNNTAMRNNMTMRNNTKKNMFSKMMMFDNI